MAEKKISKTEQRKLDAGNKQEFIGKVFQTALNALAENTVDITGGGVTVQVSFTNHNRYVHMNAYRALSDTTRRYCFILHLLEQGVVRFYAYLVSWDQLHGGATVVSVKRNGA